MIRWPIYEADELTAVMGVLSSGNVNRWTGSECLTFETEFAHMHRVKHAIAVANGTLALELALMSLNIRHGDEVIVPVRTFVASATAVMQLGAVPIFADIDYHSQNITADEILAVITENTKAIICVHLAGWPCDMDPILEVARAYNLKVIEDCAQAFGAQYKGVAVGTLGDVGCWSFCQDKIISTGGEGGMVATNDDALWESMWSFKDHGKSYKKFVGRKDGIGYRWVHDSLGSNYRMTEMQAAIGRLQIAKDETRRSFRQLAANTLVKNLGESANIKVHRPKYCSGCQSCCSCVHAYYRLYLVVDGGISRNVISVRNELIAKLRAIDVMASVGSCPDISRERVFSKSYLAPKENCFHTAESLSGCLVAIPLCGLNSVSHAEQYANEITKIVQQVDN